MQANITNRFTGKTVPLLTRKEVAFALGLAVRTVDYHIANGKIAAVRIGKSIRIRPDALEAFIASSELVQNH